MLSSQVLYSVISHSLINTLREQADMHPIRNSQGFSVLPPAEQLLSQDTNHLRLDCNPLRVCFTFSFILFVQPKITTLDGLYKLYTTTPSDF